MIRRCPPLVVMLLVVQLSAQPSFRSAIDLVLLNVTVTGTGGRHMPGLSGDDFEIFEDGQPQDLAYFAQSNVPLSVSLVLDTSASMDDEMVQAQQAAKDFVAALRAEDVAEVVSFDSRVEVLQPLTNDRGALLAAIDRLRAGGATALYNAVYIVLRQLEKLRPLTADAVRRQVIVVLSDGEDTASLVSFEQVLEFAKRSQTVIYGIALGLEPLPTKRSDAEYALRQLTQETGGRLFVPKRPEELATVYGQIANELSGQYVLGYLSNNGRADGSWRRISVRIRQPNLQARTRAGYFAPAP